jgi:sterol 3beta-glucosyltransferase
MRILIVTAGSRGDVAPYTGLGQRLQQAGHQVALAAHDRFADLVRECGLEHRALPGDPVELVRARTAAPSPEAATSVFAAFLDELGDGVVAAVTAGTDVLLTASGPAPLSRLVADGFGIPSLGVYLAPGVPTREFPPPGRPVTGQLSPADNLAAGGELLARTGFLYADVLRRLRARLGLRTAAVEAASPDDWPICHGYSPEVVPRPADWPATVHVTGYWWPAGPPGWQPPDLLVDFLGAGPPPVFIGFGSMTPHHERLHDVVAAAVGRAGVRAVVQSGWAGLAPGGRRHPAGRRSAARLAVPPDGRSGPPRRRRHHRSRAPRGGTGGSRARPGRPALLGRQAAPLRRRAAAAAPARTDRRHPERRAAGLPRPIDLP